MSRDVNTIILCEDRQHEVFARRFLALAGKHLRVLRIEINPHGRGSGEQFVRKHYVRELQYYRSRCHRVEQALIVVIDADNQPIAHRISQMEKAASEAGLAPRQSGERVAIFVCARNIESWIAYLDGQTVDELTSYPRLKLERDCQHHVEILAEMCRQGVMRKPSPQSLDAACGEYRTRLQP